MLVGFVFVLVDFLETFRDRNGILSIGFLQNATTLLLILLKRYKTLFDHFIRFLGVN